MHNIRINFSKFYSIYKELFYKGVNTKEFLIDWKHENLDDTVSSKQLNTATTTYKIMDVWAKKRLSTTAKPLAATVAVHDVLMLRLSN